VRVCIVYDCLFPWTVGGAERWYRSLAERLAADGHEVTYLTRLQWDDDDPPDLPGVRVVAVSPREPLYGPDGNRRISQALRFGRGVLGHLVRHGRRYDVVHSASFPYFSLLSAAAARPLGRYDLVVDWFEVWSREYWRSYLGATGGLIGYLVQRACVLVPQRAYCFSRLHGERLAAEGLRSPATLLQGAYVGDLTPPQPNCADPLVVFAGRHIREKRAATIPAAIALLPGHRARILGDGPERDAVRAEVARLGLQDRIDVPGFVDADEVASAMATATCLLLPSVREGYGLVVVEAARLGTPSVVVAAPDNAAVELVDDGVNGVVAPDGSPEALAAAIVAAAPLRASTAGWFARQARELSVAGSLDAVLAAYRRVSSTQS
jgi:glycosyltransferase involved in cell wall biosynthesis